MTEYIEHWPTLIVAILLLFFPPSLWLGAESKRRLSRQQGAGPFGVLGGIKAWQNWVDLVRAYAGTWILIEHATSVPDADPDHRIRLLALQAAVLGFALIVQTIRRYHRRTYFLTPAFFLWGVVAVLLEPTVAIYGIALGVIVAAVVDNVEWHLPVVAAGLAIIGYVVHGLSPRLVLACFLTIVPVVITFCGKGSMVFLMRLPNQRAGGTD